MVNYCYKAGFSNINESLLFLRHKLFKSSNCDSFYNFLQRKNLNKKNYIEKAFTSYIVKHT